jgi:hypothetical protein
VELADLKDTRKGETAWVIGSGPSLNFIDPEFFDDKLCVVPNFVGQTLQLKNYYFYSNYHSDAEKVMNETQVIAGVVLAKDTLSQASWGGDVPDNLAFSEATSYAPPGSSWDPYKMPPPEEQLVYGSSGIHGTIHLAAHLGAKDIILVGVDAGVIDGAEQVFGYPTAAQRFSFRVWNDHTIILKRWLGEQYGVRVYSLNPFINLNLEGHTFEGF